MLVKILMKEANNVMVMRRGFCANAMVGILFYLISSGFLVAMSFLDRIGLEQDIIHF